MKLSPDIYSSSDLVELVADGRLALPEFQRDFVWGPSAVVDLVLSVARRWPIGTFLFLQGPQDFAAKPLEQAPPLSTTDLLILDGQQRMTALYQALSDQAEDVYCVDFAALRKAEELLDEFIFARKRSRFLRTYSTSKALAEARIAPIPVVHDDGRFFEWLSFIPEEERSAYVELRASLLPGLKTYDIPVVRLPRDVPLAALAKIFETINRTGVRLSAFDLMVARLYPHNFNLAEGWRAARRTHPALELFDADGIEILKLIALDEHLNQVESGVRPFTIRGVRESDVLALTPEQVIERWEEAVEAYVRGLGFLSERCGVAGRTLMPATAMVLPLATILRRFSDEAEQLLERWFWASTFSQTYSQGANTQAVTDARALREAMLSDQGLDVVDRFGVDQDVFFDSRRRNDIFLRGVLCMLVLDGARDWAPGASSLAEHGEALELHQIFPTRYLADRGHDPNMVLNYTALGKDTRREISGLSPEEAIEQGLVDTAAVESHAISAEALAQNDWSEFLDQRFRAILEAVLNRAR